MSDQVHPVRTPGGKDDVWLHRFALLTAAATFVLIFVGGLVTNTGSGLAVPDWPTTFGYNMFLYPWSRMVGGILYEHSHRLIGSLVGLLTLALAIGLWIREPRRWLRWLGVIAVGAVIAQGILGGLRVVLLQPTLAIIHGWLAQAFFGLSVSLALCTSREWREEPREIQAPDARRLRRLSTLTTGLIYLQLVFGGVLTHTGAGLEVHLLFAALVAVHVPLLAARIRKSHLDRPRLVRPGTLLCGLLILQLLLGLGSYLARVTVLGAALSTLAGVGLPATHRVTGALMLATCLVLTLRAHRLLPSPNPGVGRGPVPARPIGGPEEAPA